MLHTYHLVVFFEVVGVLLVIYLVLQSVYALCLVWNEVEGDSLCTEVTVVPPMLVCTLFTQPKM